MRVVDPIGATWQELHFALEGEWRQATPLVVPAGAWRLTIESGLPVVQAWIGDRRWALRMNGDGPTGGRRAACESIASGEAEAGELVVCQRRSNAGEQARVSQVLCKTVAWLPRDAPPEEKARTRHQPAVGNQPIEEIDVGELRDAIRANKVSFPAQPPTFPSCPKPGLQYKVVLLYFVSGWKCSTIAARYGLTRAQLWHLLNIWKRRAIQAGYLQLISPE